MKTIQQVIADLDSAIINADGLDSWHRYGEGYGTVRLAVHDAIRDLQKIIGNNVIKVDFPNHARGLNRLTR